MTKNSKPDNLINFENLIFDENFQKLTEKVDETNKTIFNIICKENDELTFSRTMKYFLDPQEDHNLDDFLLRKFIFYVIKSNMDYFKNLGISRLDIDLINLSNSKVYREYYINEFGRIDILIAINQKIYIIIENKLYSSEGEDQTIRYTDWSNLKLSDNKCIMCFITPEGYPAKSTNFLNISFKDIYDIFNDDKVKSLIFKERQYLFINFLNWIKTMIPKEDTEIQRIRELYFKYKGTLDYIFENIPSKTSFLRKISSEIQKQKNDSLITVPATYWLIICPKKWLNHKILKVTSKYTLPRLEFSFYSDDFILYLVTQDSKTIKQWFYDNSLKIFERKIDDTDALVKYDQCYYEILKKNIIPESLIDNFDIVAKEYAEKAIYLIELIYGKLDENMIKSWEDETKKK